MEYAIVAVILIVAIVKGLLYCSSLAERKLSMKTRHVIATTSVFVASFAAIVTGVLIAITALLPSGGFRTTFIVLSATAATAMVLGGIGHMIFYLPHYSLRTFLAKTYTDKEIATKISNTAIEKIIRVTDPVGPGDLAETKDQLLGRITALRHILRYCYRYGFISVTAVDILAEATTEEVLNRTITEDESHEQRLDSYVKEMRKQQLDLRQQHYSDLD